MAGAIICIVVGGVSGFAGMLIYCIIRCAGRPEPILERDPVTVYLMERELVRIDQEYRQLVRETEWRGRL